MKSKLVIGRVLIELVVLLMVLSTIDSMTSPSESTGVAVQEAVSKKQLEPICMVEVLGAIRSASFVRFTFSAVGIAAVVLLASDLLLLWQSRRKVEPSKGD